MPIINNPITILQNSCLICLTIDKLVIKYHGTCKCNLYVHQKCLEEWNNSELNKNKPIKCMICKKELMPPIQENQSDPNENTCGLCCCMYLCSIFCMSVTGILR